MERAILKTLIYADIFEYPLKAWEIHKWLVSEKSDLPEVEKGLKRLLKKKKIYTLGDLYYLKGRRKIVQKRLSKQKTSEYFLKEAKGVSKLFKMIPGVLLVGISGSLAMENSEKKDDIDLFVITKKGQLWISRFLLLSVLAVLGKRRSRDDLDPAGKLCLNILLEEDELEQSNKDIYTAHEVLQMRPLWQRDGIYSKYLLDNEWAFKFLPNWITNNVILEPGLPGDRIYKRSYRSPLASSRMTQVVESVFMWLQVRYMGRPSGKERLSGGAVYFHPEDVRERILKEFKKRCLAKKT